VKPGRFRVVANEVRNLALRATEAAKNTADLIEDTVTRVKEGSDLVNRTATAFSWWRTAPSGQRAGGGNRGRVPRTGPGSEQINRAIIEMDKMVQQNAPTLGEQQHLGTVGGTSQQMTLVVDDLVALVGAP